MKLKTTVLTPYESPVEWRKRQEGNQIRQFGFCLGFFFFSFFQELTVKSVISRSLSQLLSLEQFNLMQILLLYIVISFVDNTRLISLFQMIYTQFFSVSRYSRSTAHKVLTPCIQYLALRNYWGRCLPQHVDILLISTTHSFEKCQPSKLNN